MSRGKRGPSKSQRVAAGFVPAKDRARVVEEVRTVTDRDACDLKTALAKREGLLVGSAAVPT